LQSGGSCGGQRRKKVVVELPKYDGFFVVFKNERFSPIKYFKRTGKCLYSIFIQ
jgi:hypothetical protein